MSLEKNLEDKLLKVKSVNKIVRNLTVEKKNALLRDIALGIEERSAEILNANMLDLQSLNQEAAMAFIDRLTLNEKRIGDMAKSLRQVAELPDPVNELLEEKILNNKLKLKRVRAPLGIILMIFESRPNVILEAFSLAFKAGNSIILRGGSESQKTAQKIYEIMNQKAAELGFPSEIFIGIEDYNRNHVAEMLKRKDLIDIVVPRGGDKLIEYVQSNALMPIIKNDRGLCHTYVDEQCDLDMAISIVNNAKTQRPGVCNSLETVLVHRKIAVGFLEKLYRKTEAVQLQWRVDSETQALFVGKSRVSLASEESWNTEYLDQIINCKIVGSLDEALAHIEKYGSRHSECIVTENETKAQRFLHEVDAAAVYWNASTRFTDGFEFGLGGELGISTQKLHVRGPVGLRELTTPRWIIIGDGQIRT